MSCALGERARVFAIQKKGVVQPRLALLEKLQVFYSFFLNSSLAEAVGFQKKKREKLAQRDGGGRFV
jgi:hypothetical protein